MIKKVALIILTLFCIGFIAYGYLSYNHKLATRQKVPLSTAASSTSSSSDKVLLSDAAKLPKSVQNQLSTALSQKKPLNLTIVAPDNASWIGSLTDALNKTYGSAVWDVRTATYQSQTSSDLLTNNFAAWIEDRKPDVLLYEVPLLNDSGQIDVATTAANTEQLLSSVTKAYPNLTILVQPSNPIYNGIHYPSDEVTLKNLLSTNYTYVDYWSAFPATNTPAMQALVVNDGSFYTLNADGYQLWTNYLINYFTNH